MATPSKPLLCSLVCLACSSPYCEALLWRFWPGLGWVFPSIRPSGHGGIWICFPSRFGFAASWGVPRTLSLASSIPKCSHFRPPCHKANSPVSSRLLPNCDSISILCLYPGLPTERTSSHLPCPDFLHTHCPLRTGSPLYPCLGSPRHCRTILKKAGLRFPLSFVHLYQTQVRPFTPLLQPQT